MSDGPIKREREAFGKRSPVSTNPQLALHMAGEGQRRYCGHRGGKVTNTMRYVDCSACVAAWEADQ